MGVLALVKSQSETSAQPIPSFVPPQLLNHITPIKEDGTTQYELADLVDIHPSHFISDGEEGFRINYTPCRRNTCMLCGQGGNAKINARALSNLAQSGCYNFYLGVVNHLTTHARLYLRSIITQLRKHPTYAPLFNPTHKGGLNILETANMETHKLQDHHLNLVFKIPANVDENTQKYIIKGLENFLKTLYHYLHQRGYTTVAPTYDGPSISTKLTCYNNAAKNPFGSYTHKNLIGGTNNPTEAYKKHILANLNANNGRTNLYSRAGFYHSPDSNLTTKRQRASLQGKANHEIFQQQTALYNTIGVSKKDTEKYYTHNLAPMIYTHFTATGSKTPLFRSLRALQRALVSYLKATAKKPSKALKRLLLKTLANPHTTLDTIKKLTNDFKAKTQHARKTRQNRRQRYTGPNLFTLFAIEEPQAKATPPPP